MLFEIEAFYRVEDGDDWLCAVTRAQNEWMSTRDSFHRNDGFTLHFGPREYKFSESIQLIRGMSLVGSGGAGSLAGTSLKFGVGKHGIICNFVDTAPSPSRGRADSSIIERLRIEGGGGSASADDAIACGIIMFARMNVRDCYINNFSGDGIRIDASVVKFQLFRCDKIGSTGKIEPAFLEFNLPGNIGSTIDSGSIGSIIIDGDTQWNYVGACSQWLRGAYHQVNDLLLPTKEKRTGYVYKCTESLRTSRSGPTQPDPWPTNIGEPKRDGDVTWQCFAKYSSWEKEHPYTQDEYILTEKATNANNWQVQNCSIYNCENGLFVIGGDANAGCAIAVDCSSNRGWGIYEYSFLGNTYVACHCASNKRGPYYVRASAAPCVLINCYSEEDQPPSHTGPNAHVIGGLHGAGFTSNSHYFGGLNYAAIHPITALSHSNVPAFTASGTNPPQVTLRGNIPFAYRKIELKVTNAGYPGGIDPNGNNVPGADAQIQWNIDDSLGHILSGDVTLNRADNPYQYGLSTIQLGDTGLTAYFTPGYYSIDNNWSLIAGGGLQAQFTIGSDDGTMSAFQWGHTNPASGDGGDPGVWYLNFINQEGNSGYGKRWALQWANSPVYTSLYLSSGRALPYPGTVTFDNLWYGTRAAEDNERRIANADASSGLPGSIPWMDSTASKVGWWLPGDVIFNRSKSDRWPIAWRPAKPGGISLSPYGYGDPWHAKSRYYPGMSIEPGNGFLYRARKAGDTSDSQPAMWPTVIGEKVSDGTQVWECFSQAENSFEPILDCSPTMLEKDCSLGGDIVLSVDEIAHARYKLTGSPTGNFSVTIGSGVSGSWDRIVLNSSNHEARIKTSSADPGITIPSNTAYRLLNDGSIMIKVQ